MYGKVLIGEKEIGMAANAASPIIYRNIFHEDFLRKVQEKDPDVDLFQKMGYVMAMQAKTSKMSELTKLNFDSYVEWLSQFEPMDIITATGQMSDIYFGNTIKNSDPKKKGA
jgi:hypothetical protein